MVIRLAKDVSRQEMLDNLDRDSWNRPYRAAGNLTRVVEDLFPRRADHMLPV